MSNTDDIPLKTKVSILKAYIYHLRMEAELGIGPTGDEIRLARAGMADINGELNAAMKIILPYLKQYVNGISHTFGGQR